MADDIDAMLQGEEGENTPSATPAGKKTPVTVSGNPIEGGAEQLSPEEVEFNSLKGSTQDRIKHLIAERNRLSEEMKTRSQFAPSTQPNSQPDPEVQNAVHKLSDVGIATDEKVDRKINDSLSLLRWQMDLDRLETKYSGEDGRPKFDRDEYNDYRSRHPEYANYLPEDVYEKMYREELDDWRVQHAGQPSSNRMKPLRPTKTTLGGEEPLSPEMIEARLKEPDGREWYEKNLEKINKILSRTG